MSTAPKVFDALIVGAGPAGSYLGYLLAKQGRRVAIIDKERFPRDKVCGGGITRKAVDLLDFDIGPVVHRYVRGAYLTFLNRRTVVKDIDRTGMCTVVRREFDRLLLDKACEAGASFVAGARFLEAAQHADSVTTRTSLGEFESRLLCAADGAASTVRAEVFGKNAVRYVPSLEALVEVEDHEMSAFAERAVLDFGAMPRGYGWIFPKRDHLNVGVYSPYGGQSLRAHLDHFMSLYRCMRQPASVRRLGFVIPVHNATHGFQRGRVWLLGDAAGFAECVFGEGIYFALKSAILAARAIDAERNFAQSLRYTQLLREELLPELRASRWLGKAVYRFQDFSFSHLVANERVNHDFAKLITGEVGYRECAVATAWNFAMWARPARPCENRVEL